MFLTVLLRILTIFAIMGVGFFAHRKGILPDESEPYLVRLLLDFAMPAMVLAALMNRKMTASMLSETIQVLLATLIVLIVLFFLSFLMVRPLRYEPAEDRGILMAVVVGSNTAFMGYPIAQSVFGDRIFYLVVMSNLIWSFYIFGFSTIHITLGAPGKRSGKTFLKKFLSPTIITTLIGCLFLFFSIPVPDFIYDCVDMIGQMTVPLSMILIGVQLSQSDLAGILRNPKLIAVSLMNLILCPLIALGLMSVLPFTEEVRLTVVFLTTLPTAVIISAITEQEGRNYLLAAQGISLSTLLSLVTVPCWIIVLKMIYSF